MERIYKHLSDDTLKELYVAIKRAQDELMSKAPVSGVLHWYMAHVFAEEQIIVLAGVWSEMYERGLLDDDFNVVS